jgi:hypothetical protein
MSIDLCMAAHPLRRTLWPHTIVRTVLAHYTHPHCTQSYTHCTLNTVLYTHIISEAHYDYIPSYMQCSLAIHVLCSLRSMLWPHTIDIYALYSHTTCTLTMHTLLSEARYTYHHILTVMTVLTSHYYIHVLSRACYGHTPSYTHCTPTLTTHHHYTLLNTAHT